MSAAKVFLEWLHNSGNVWVFTGAGISTLSGIPDFRGAGGVYSNLWKGRRVEEILSLACFNREPELFYEWAQGFVYRCEEYEPNTVHRTVARWEEKGLIRGVYTQNIDMLHQRAGSRNVFELHGSPAVHRCRECGHSENYDFAAPLVMAGEMPVCSVCGNVLKPEIVFYGESLDGDMLNCAVANMQQADLVLCCGTSLAVNPAATLPAIALQSGAKLVIVNAGATPLDKYAALRADDLEEFFSGIAAEEENGRA